MCASISKKEIVREAVAVISNILRMISIKKRKVAVKSHATNFKMEIVIIIIVVGAMINHANKRKNKTKSCCVQQSPRMAFAQNKLVRTCTANGKKMLAYATMKKMESLARSCCEGKDATSTMKKCAKSTITAEGSPGP